MRGPAFTGLKPGVIVIKKRTQDAGNPRYGPDWSGRWKPRGVRVKDPVGSA